MKVKYLLMILVTLAFGFIILYSWSYDPQIVSHSCQVTGTLTSPLDELLPITCPNGKIFDGKSIGYSNIEGDIVLIDEDWVNVSIFYDNHFAIVTNQNQLDGIINKRGQFILEYEYHQISYLGENRYFLKKNIDDETHYFLGQYEEGNINIKEVFYEYMYDYHEGLAAVINHNKIGYVDKEGDVIIPFIYDRNPLLEHRFYDGLAVVIKNDYYGVINKHNEVIISFLYDYIEPGNEDEIFLKFCKDGKWGVMNTQYKEVLPPTYQSIGNDSENIISVSLDDIHYAFLNLESNQFMTDFIYKTASHQRFTDQYNYYDNHYAVVTKDSIHFNLLDLEGKEILSSHYLGIKVVNDSLVLLKYDEESFYLYNIQTKEMVELSGIDILIYPGFEVLAICNEYYEDGAMIYELYDFKGEEIIPGLKVYDYMIIQKINNVPYLHFNGELERKVFSSYFDSNMHLIWQP